MNRPCGPLRRFLPGLIALAAACVLLAAGLATVAWRAIAARDDQWSMRLRAGVLGRTIEHEASVAVLARLATHPLVRPLLDGRALPTTQGLWRAQARTDGSLALVCSPCALSLSALGPAPLTVERAEVVVRADGADRYRGTLHVGQAPRALVFEWRGRFDNAGRQFQIDLALPRTPLADAVHVLGRELPERDRVRVGGTIALTLDARWPQGPWRLRPQVDGFSVEGLGTERLIDLQRPMACRVDADAGVPTLEGWLPRAVIAAEDQRFLEHPGYDLAAMVDAWQHNQRPGVPLVGASTLTQQLAKIAFTGDERNATRKLRELLYAVEMERTLGKARIVQLYLALAPWGDGVCGAQRAVRVHLGQRDASTVGPVAAAWLASLLPAPDTLLHADQARGSVDTARVERVLEAMRPMRPERREKALAQLPYWSPPAIDPPRPALLPALP